MYDVIKLVVQKILTSELRLQAKFLPVTGNVKCYQQVFFTVGFYKKAIWLCSFCSFKCSLIGICREVYKSNITFFQFLSKVDAIQPPFKMDIQ